MTKRFKTFDYAVLDVERTTMYVAEVELNGRTRKPELFPDWLGDEDADLFFQANREIFFDLLEMTSCLHHYKITFSEIEDLRATQVICSDDEVTLCLEFPDPSALNKAEAVLAQCCEEEGVSNPLEQIIVIRSIVADEDSWELVKVAEEGKWGLGGELVSAKLIELELI